MVMTGVGVARTIYYSGTSYMCPLVCLHLPEGVHMVIPCGAVATVVFLHGSEETASQG